MKETVLERLLCSPNPNIINRIDYVNVIAQENPTDIISLINKNLIETPPLDQEAQEPDLTGQTPEHTDHPQ